MEKYDYREAVLEDIREYIRNEVELKDYADKEEAFDDLNEKLWIEDSVTGNGSGSYFFSTWKAEEALCHNLDLLDEALEEFGCEPDYLAKNGAEACDVTIRCFLLGGCLSEVLEEMWSDEDEDEEEDEETEEE